MLIVGEVKLRLDDRGKRGERDVFEDLEEKARAVRVEYGEEEIVRVLITQYATKGVMREARERVITGSSGFQKIYSIRFHPGWMFRGI